MRNRFWSPYVALYALLALSPAHAADTCVVRVPRISNAFFDGEPIRLSVSLTPPLREVRYRVLDFYGKVRADTTMMVGGEQAVTIPLQKNLGIGWYHLTLTWNTGTHSVDFCVLPPPWRDPGDYSIFGLVPNNGSTDLNLEAAALMGVRLIRQTVPWPPFEPARGDFRMELLDNWYALGRKYGVQMLLILGYTPGFLGEKPINYLDWWVNNCNFTWHVKEPNEYGRYLDKVTGFARGKTITWPASSILPATAPPPQQVLPWAHSWEMWNEADILFYVGDWNRYMEMLHMAWAAGRQRVPEAAMVYGGSTGNWVALGQVASGSAKYCFDYVGLHTGGAVEQALRVWYGGSQQIPWCVGAPRETSHTECYAQGRREGVDYPIYHETPGELQRCYLTVKAWREAAFYRSGCLGGFIWEDGMMAPGTSLLVPRNGKLEPTPLYPAFAAVRQLLSDAVEVGPVDLGPNTTAHIFLKHGEVMLAAWSDDNAMATLQLAPGSRQLDCFNKARNWGDKTRLSTPLGPEPTIFLGASDDYLREAIERRFALLANTAYGTPQTNPGVGWYVSPMMADLADLLGAGAGGKLAALIPKVARIAQQTPEQGPSAVTAAQTACLELMGALVGKCRVGEEVPVKIANNVWRLARMDEWLGEIADDRSGLWQNLQVTAADVAQMKRRLGYARLRQANRRPDAYCPLAASMMDRTQWQCWRLEQVQRRGTYNAMAHKLMVAERLIDIEKAYVMRVVPIIDFTTSRPFRKARVLEPGQTHTLTVWAYNYLDHPVSGTLRLKLPTAWSPNELTVPFTAGVTGPSAMVPMQVTLPEEPRPWIKAASFTMDGMINVSLPSSLGDNPTIEVTGQLSTGQPIAPMTYFVNVGHWLDDPALQAGAPAAALQAADNGALQLPPSVKQQQLRSLMEEMARLNRQPRGRMAVQ